MSLHHKLCHPLVGSLNLSHTETHTVVLPHVLSYVALNIPQAMGRLAQVLPDSKGDAIRDLNVFLTKLEVWRSLRELGMKREDIGRAAEIAMTKAYWTPRDIREDDLRELMRRCWAGEEARADF